ncbi:MAG: 50S ribosomal protein L29 [Gemmatimonadaceae bacterium]
MRAEEIRELTEDEIQSRLAELSGERFRLKFRAATEVLEDPLRFRILRKDIARLKTVLRERQSTGRERAAAKPASARSGAAR